MNMKECRGYNDMCCNPICDHEDLCASCERQRLEAMKKKYNHGDLYQDVRL